MPDFQHRDCTLVYDDHPGPTERAPVLLLHGLGSSARDWEYQLPERPWPRRSGTSRR